MFALFRDRMARYMFDIFDEHFWSVTIPQASMMYPSVWHVMVATAAMGHIHLNEAPDKVQLTSFALKHCNLALQHLIKVLPHAATQAEREMLLLTCILLISYSTMSGSVTECLTHINNGMYMSSLWHRAAAGDPKKNSQQVSSVSTLPSTSINIRFRRLGALVWLLPGPGTRMSFIEDSCVISPHAAFNSSTEAYLELLAIDAQWKTVARSDDPYTGAVVLRFIGDQFVALREPFRRWRKKLHAFQAASKTANSLDQQERARLRILQMLEYTFETMCLGDPTKGQLYSDEFNSRFEQIMELYKDIVEAKIDIISSPGQKETVDLLHSCQYRAMLGPPLIQVAHGCRLRSVRLKAIEMLKRIAFRDGVFDSNAFAKVLEETAHIESTEAIIDPRKQGCDCIPYEFTCNWHRVSEVIMLPGLMTLRTTQNVAMGTPGHNIYTI